MPETKTSFRIYSAWNYEKEIEDLNRFSESGWQLKKGGCFHSTFVKNPDIRYRYQLDYQNIDDMGRYIETFREQGWEYINSTFNGWHYFRKLYDPSLPEEEYEIFTDRESLHEMNSRWARLALIIGVIIGLFAVLSLIRLILHPHLPALILFLTFAVESSVLIRGAIIMKNPDASRNRRGDGALLAVFLAVVIIGCTLSITLTELRPSMSCQQYSGDLSAPVTDNVCGSFTVKYKDNYFFDFDAKSASPLTLKIVSKSGETAYIIKGEEIHGDDVRVMLSKGDYDICISAQDGYNLEYKIQ